MTIEIQGVSRFFGRFKAIDDVSFSVRNSEVVGYVGLNGAGKTTTIRIVVGVLPPSSGDVLIDGLSITREKKKASWRIGWVPELPIFETEFRALDYFVYLAGYYGLSRPEALKLGRELLEKFGLGESLNMKLSAYSQGMKKRFALAVSMINDPPNFVFDEVLNGLDPKGIAFFRELTLEFRRRGKAVLFSSHILSEVEGIADRVVFVHRGRIVGEYTMDEIKYRAGSALELVLSSTDESVLKLLKKYGELNVIGGQKVLLRNISSDIGDITTELVKHGVKVYEVKREERSLEDFFFNLIKEVEGKC
ncbi:MAG: ABC transporter ATP-binding protein [Desulfurococcaceae archaeon]